MQAPGTDAMPASAASVIGPRRKRVLDDFAPMSLGVNQHEHEAEMNHRRSSFHGMPSDYYADVHSGFQANNLMKSRRIGAADRAGQDDTHTVLLGPIRREALVPLAATGSPRPQPNAMNETLVGSPFMPPASTSSSLSTTQLENFRLDSAPSSAEIKSTKPRVTKPLAKRPLHATSHSGTHLTAQHLPALSQYLQSQGASRQSTQRRYSSGLPNPFSTSVNASPAHSSSMVATTVGSPVIGPRTPAIHPDAGTGVRSEVAIAFGPASDQCSSDEEFSMENEISLSQDKLNNLSVHDIADDFLEDGNDNQRPPNEALIVMELAKGFAGTLSAKEARELKEIGAYTVPLQVSTDPIVLGRDHFFPIFGDKIRGCETFHISRKHCVFHVTPTDSKDASKPFKIMVENTSTNGLEVNGRPMKNLEQRELHTGDTVTLLKIRNHGVDISLGYTLQVKQAKVTTQAPDRHPIAKRSPRTRPQSNSRTHLARKPRSSSCSNPFGLPLSPPKKKYKFPTIQINVLIADPFIATVESPRQPSRSYRDELSATLSVFSNIDRLKVVYEYASKQNVPAAMQNHNNIVIYAGGCESNRLLMEDQAGMPAFLEVDELLKTVSPMCLQSQLVVVFAKTMSSAQLFVDAGFQHVIYVNSSTPTRMKSAIYLKALLSSLLIGAPVKEAHRMARRTTLGMSSVTPASNECLCGILPNGSGHHITPGIIRGAVDDTSFSILSTLLLPVLPVFFAPPKDVVGEIVGGLRNNHSQVSILHGGVGVGKSSTAVYVAKHAIDRCWYNGGVHFIDVEAAFREEGEQAKADHTLGWADDISLSDDQRQRISRRVINEVDELLQILHARETPSAKLHAFVVLDGCDHMNAAQFRDFIVKTVQAYPHLQILLTAREQLQINIHTKVVEERTIHMKELPASVAASVFLAMARLCVAPERLKKALPSESAETLSNHPALTRLNGNPLLLSRLVNRLRIETLDELV